MATESNVSTKVVIPCRFSYAHVWEAHSIEEGGEKKFSVSCIIPKSDTATVEKVKAAIRAAYETGISSKFNGKKPAKWKNPLRDGDDDRPDDENYKDSYFINSSCKTRPGVVDKARQPITDQDEFYSGCYGYVSINFYPFNTSGNMGVAAGLNNVMKTKDGEPLGGRSSAEEDFADVDMSDAPFPMGGDDNGDDIFN